MSRFCPKCGSQVPDAAAFCGSCGFSLARDGAGRTGAAAPWGPVAMAVAEVAGCALMLACLCWWASAVVGGLDWAPRALGRVDEPLATIGGAVFIALACAPFLLALSSALMFIGALAVGRGKDAPGRRVVVVSALACAACLVTVAVPAALPGLPLDGTFVQALATAVSDAYGEVAVHAAIACLCAAIIAALARWVPAARASRA